MDGAVSNNSGTLAVEGAIDDVSLVEGEGRIVGAWELLERNE